MHEATLTLSDGDRGKFIVHCSGKMAKIFVQPDLSNDGQNDVLHVYVGGTRPCITVPLSPDPLRAAVQANTERIKDLLAQWISTTAPGVSVADRKRLETLIDAPTEEKPSEYAKGAAAMHRTMLDLVRRWKSAVLTSERFEHMVIALEGLEEPIS